jgi:hypothetical protein
MAVLLMVVSSSDIYGPQPGMNDDTFCLSVCGKWKRHHVLGLKSQGTWYMPTDSLELLIEPASETKQDTTRA